MEKAIEPSRSPARSLRHGYVFLFWGAMLVVVYFLSLGPTLWYYDKSPTSKAGKLLDTVYGPLGWCYEETPLRKPIGMYLSLWSKRFGRDGEKKD
jgi:hypothetical protein